MRHATLIFCSESTIFTVSDNFWESPLAREVTGSTARVTFLVLVSFRETVKNGCKHDKKRTHLSLEQKISAIEQQITRGERDIGVKLHSIVTQSSLSKLNHHSLGWYKCRCENWETAARLYHLILWRKRHFGTAKFGWWSKCACFK